ncbi:MAG: flagellar hook-basal body protein [Verrucomicrobiia bacterium]
MNVSLYHAASALSANARWQEVISENLAATGIPGFKKQDISFEAVQAGLMSPGSSGLQQAFALPQVRSATNFSQGELRMTSVKTDVAIEGPGFFTVQLPSGATGYTRDGEFRVNAQGQLTTKQGYAVLGDGGPIQLDLSEPADITISSTGEVSQGTELRAKLRVVDFRKPELLVSAGGGCFVARDPALIPIDVAQPSVRQGCLEGANTTAVSEMANLITAMRAFEANQRVIQLQDERMSRAISELGNPQ